jgi:hypothetical protein
LARSQSGARGHGLRDRCHRVAIVAGKTDDETQGPPANGTVIHPTADFIRTMDAADREPLGGLCGSAGRPAEPQAVEPYSHGSNRRFLARRSQFFREPDPAVNIAVPSNVRISARPDQLILRYYDAFFRRGFRASDRGRRSPKARSSRLSTAPIRSPWREFVPRFSPSRSYASCATCRISSAVKRGRARHRNGALPASEMLPTRERCFP